MRTACFFLYALLLAWIQTLDAQPVNIGPSRQPGEMALVKEGGKIYGLQLGKQTRYRWAEDGWVEDGGLKVQLPGRRLPFMHQSKALRDSKGNWLIHVLGFGHLWKYRDGALTRLDTTFFAGSNFGANRFVYRDTVYSHGGYGFWIYHGVLSYFDPRYKEWERVVLNGAEEPLQPNPIAAFAGDGVRWVWSVSEATEPNARPVFEPRGTVYAFDLKKRRVEPAGHIRWAIWKILGNPVTAWDSVVLTHGAEGGLLIHLAKNEVRRIPPDVLYGFALAPLDAWGSGCVAMDDTLEIFTTKDRARSNILVHNRFALKDLWEQSEPLGSFVEPKWISGLKRNYWLGLLTAIISIGSWWWGRNRSRRPVGPTAFVQSLDRYERLLLQPLMSEGPGRKWTTHEFDDALGTSDKSWENQRKIRKTTINDLNHKASLYLGLESFICDERDVEDRREKRYFVVPEGFVFKRDLLELLNQPFKA